MNTRLLEIIADRLERIESLEVAQIRLELKIGEFFANLEGKIMTALTDLQAAVAAEDTVIASAMTLIQGIPALIAAAGTDPAALAALTADIQAQSANLAAAITANTPVAAPAPAPAPAPADGSAPAP